MSKIIVDHDLRSKLNGLNAEISFCDEAGRVIGHYLPADLYRKMLYAVAAAEISDEEIEQARQEPAGGVPLSDIWKSISDCDARAPLPGRGYPRSATNPERERRDSHGTAPAPAGSNG